ncbi:MAG: alpha/beta fold hydrolase [Rhodospirillaceae bacterium]|nr:alpha/beta fold hydrolase [Rhodospirillaceae bacterium]
MPATRAYCSGPFGQIHYYDTGQGIPLALCPQAPMSARQYERVFDALAARGIRAIGVDTPGFGMSDVPKHVPTIADFAKAVPAVLDALNLSRAHILGHHTGALIATEVAVTYPKRIASLVMNGPLPTTPEERKQFMAWVEGFERPFTSKQDGSHIAEWWKRRSGFAKPDTDWNLMTRYVCEPLIGFGPFWHGHHAAFLYDHAASIARVSCPALILTNTGDQIYEHAQRARKLRPDFAYAELEGGGIDIVDEKPEAWVDAVAGFVLRQPKF